VSRSQHSTALAPAARRAPLPRLGFLGLGRIGRRRLRSVLDAGTADVVAVADVDPLAGSAAAADALGAERLNGLEELLARDLDGVVIATPSALHAEQAITALARGCAVFCQKPVGRDADETRAVLAAAREADRLLAADLCYRETEAVRAIKGLLDGGEIGHVHTAELTFHNAYGPDKPWFHDPALAGGGCLVDLGTHLVDLALWLLDDSISEVRASRTLREGRPLAPGGGAVEDHALAELGLASGAVARIACSWWLPAGRDCVFEVALYGTEGAAIVRNLAGSFFDFEAELCRGTSAQSLVRPPDDWGGRVINGWARRLAADGSHDTEAERLVDVAAALDAIYASAR